MIRRPLAAATVCLSLAWTATTAAATPPQPDPPPGATTVRYNAFDSAWKATAGNYRYWAMCHIPVKGKPYCVIIGRVGEDGWLLGHPHR